MIAAGRVSTQAISRLRMVAICRPEPFVAMVPATPDDNTCAVGTGRPNTSAAPMVTAATDHGAQPKRDRDGDLYPGRNELGRAVERGLVVKEKARIAGP